MSLCGHSPQSHDTNWIANLTFLCYFLSCESGKPSKEYLHSSKKARYHYLSTVHIYGHLRTGRKSEQNWNRHNTLTSEMMWYETMWYVMCNIGSPPAENILPNSLHINHKNIKHRLSREFSLGTRWIMLFALFFRSGTGFLTLLPTLFWHLFLLPCWEYIHVFLKILKRFQL